MKGKKIRAAFALVLACVLILTSVPTGASAATAYTPEKLYEKVAPTTVRIETVDSEGTPYIGSGFFIKKNQIITNYHVVEAASNIRILGLDDTEYHISKIQNYDEENDLIIFKVKEENKNYLKFASSAKSGQSVWCVGNPLGLNGSYIDAMVSRVHKELDGIDYMQISMPSGTGIGGAPIVNKYGNVVAIACMVVTTAQCISLCIPFATCKDFVDGKIGGGTMPMKSLYAKTAGQTKETNYYNISESDEALFLDPIDYQSRKTDADILSSEEIAEASENYMVDIYITASGGDLEEPYTVHGSGFFIKEDLIMTNHHVLSDLETDYHTEIQIKDYSGNTYTKTDIFLPEDKNIDIAAMRVEVPKDAKHGIAKLNITYRPIVGETVYSNGSPVGYSGAFTHGIISMSYRKVLDFPYIHITNPIASGNSGGALINKYGEVFGIITLTTKAIEKSNFALNIGMAAGFVTELMQ